MKTEKEKQLEIQLLTEKIQRISGKKVVFTEMNSYWNNITYLFKVSVLFEGFEPTLIEGKIIITNNLEPSEEELKNAIDKRLKVFTNIVSCEIISVDKALEGEETQPQISVEPIDFENSDVEIEDIEEK